MSKRGHHEGNIVQLKDGRFRGRMMLGYKPGTFKANKVNVYGKDRQEVKDKMNELYRDFQAKQGVMPSEWTVGSWLDHYLENYVRLRTRRVTYDNYEILARRHIKPEIGKIKLSELTTSHVQLMLRRKSQSGSVKSKGKGLGASIIRTIRHICRQAMAQAVSEGLILKNPVLATTPMRQGNVEKAVLTREQAEQFLQVAKEHRLFCLFHLYISTGMRRSEALALRWSDFDTTLNLIHIARARTKYSEPNEWFSEPKTPSSRRRIPLTEDVVQALKDHQTRQSKEKTAAGKAYRDYNLIFCREDGCPIHPDTITGMTIKIMKRANLPEFTPHSLRHSFTSMLGQLGVSPKVTQELLGHTTIRMTMDVYSHVMPGMKEAAIKQLGNLLSEKQPDVVAPDKVGSEEEHSIGPIMPEKKLHEAKAIYLPTLTTLRKAS